MHTVAVLALDNFVAFDLSIACEVFSRARKGGKPAYRVQVCGNSRMVRSHHFAMRVEHRIDVLARANTIIIPGIEDPSAKVPEAVLQALRSAWKRGARIASICSGAFVLAESGLLDGKRATTHWLGTKQLAELYPKVIVEPEVLFVDEGRIITSAGSSAGLDMCLHLVGRDHGQAVAAHSARLAVAPLCRDGGQAQFISYEPPDSGASLVPLLAWLAANLEKPLTVDALAKRARMSPRTFARRFREQTGITPMKWLVTARVRRAQELLQTCNKSIDEVAFLSGFDSTVTFRARFRAIVKLTPTEYRRRFSAEYNVKQSRKTVSVV